MINFMYLCLWPSAILPFLRFRLTASKAEISIKCKENIRPLVLTGVFWIEMNVFDDA